MFDSLLPTITGGGGL
ncbi:G-ACD-00350 [African swine fever virus]|uniref:ASFV_G_ACD_00350 n=1 Tax=African swine fever virus TaxID=10497 RepID=A0A8A1VAS1_ASF|nr:ASFV_G_ACD_00350 [African swine fever virus]UVH34982.1 G-ACD-00350 [African swine fever virus]UVH35893.1 G-ACD-00350 [African swine fever virus]